LGHERVAVTTYNLRRELWVPHSLPEVFDFFSRAENPVRITPPWMRFRILTPPPIQMNRGTTIAYGLRIRGIPLRWLTQIVQWDPPYAFVDLQAKGPYRYWHHTHRFSEVDGGTSIVDIVEYELPFGLLGRLVHRLRVARDLEQIFDYRARRVQSLFP